MKNMHVRRKQETQGSNSKTTRQQSKSLSWRPHVLQLCTNRRVGWSLAFWSLQGGTSETKTIMPLPVPHPSTSGHLHLDTQKSPLEILGHQLMTSSEKRVRDPKKGCSIQGGQLSLPPGPLSRQHIVLKAKLEKVGTSRRLKKHPGDADGKSWESSEFIVLLDRCTWHVIPEGLGLAPREVEQPYHQRGS